MQIRRQGEEETTGASADTPPSGSADDNDLKQTKGEAFPVAVALYTNLYLGVRRWLYVPNLAAKLPWARLQALSFFTMVCHSWKPLGGEGGSGSAGSGGEQLNLLLKICYTSDPDVACASC